MFPFNAPLLLLRMVAAAKAMAAAEKGLRQAHLDFAHARAREAVATRAAFDAVETWKDAVAAEKFAKAKVQEADRRGKAVSVFISKKEGRVFVRQDWKDVYEAPVTVRDADRPLGTHVYVALGAEPGGSLLKWTAVTIAPALIRQNAKVSNWLSTLLRPIALILKES